MSKLFVDEIVHQSSQGSGTITLGASGETVALASGATNNIGISVADQWRITSNQSITDTSTTAVTANWERIDTTGQGTLGTGMSESSGEFTFPSTGIYSVQFNTAAFNSSSSGDVRYFFGYIYMTTDNSTYNLIARSANGNNSHASAYWFSTHSQTFVDVTDTSLIKIKFYVATSLATSSLAGDTAVNNTTATFIRLGDT